MLASLYARMGQIYKRRLERGESQDYKTEQALAIEYFRKAVELQKELSLEIDLASTLNNLANLYYSQGRYSARDTVDIMSIKQISLNTDQLIDFQQWKKANAGDFSLWDYLFGIANVEVAIVFTKLFWPDFVEHEGGIFLSEAFNIEKYDQWKAQLGNDITSIERVMNHQHIDDILPGADKVGTDNLFYLGQAIAQMWESRLKRLYPHRRFQFCCNWDEYTLVVMFYQVTD